MFDLTGLSLPDGKGGKCNNSSVGIIADIFCQSLLIIVKVRFGGDDHQVRGRKRGERLRRGVQDQSGRIRNVRQGGKRDMIIERAVVRCVPPDSLAMTEGCYRRLRGIAIIVFFVTKSEAEGQAGEKAQNEKSGGKEFYNHAVARTGPDEAQA